LQKRNNFFDKNMVKKSAGLLLYHFRNKTLQVLLVHPGGPFWKNKDVGSWSIPKGEIEEGEEPLIAAARETEEETGISVNPHNCISLTPVKQKSGKIIYAWAKEANFETDNIKSNLFEMEWPPKSGKKSFFPEVDKANWFYMEEAEKKIIPGQTPLLKELQHIIEKMKMMDK
jgi:predicted NUDIX family NTP pyrophosphohydrolase